MPQLLRKNGLIDKRVRFTILSDPMIHYIDSIYGEKLLVQTVNFYDIKKDKCFGSIHVPIQDIPRNKEMVVVLEKVVKIFNKMKKNYLKKEKTNE